MLYPITPMRCLTAAKFLRSASCAMIITGAWDTAC